MNSEEVLYNNIVESPRSPRKVVLKRLATKDERILQALRRKHPTPIPASTEETWCVAIDYRIRGLLHSTFKQEDHTRKEAVNKLNHQFETHLDREALKADLRQKSSVQPVQRKIEEHDPQSGERGANRNVWDFYKKNSAQTVWHIGRQGSCIAHTEPDSIIISGLIPGGRSLNRDRQSVFHSREPDVRESRSGRRSIRSG